ncbi:MAG TPA: hypothetical protein VEJ84_06465 [Acidimicrobiales bacterium]|nr:hypothetical protein [Acidimicrobiales bacterium]
MSARAMITRAMSTKACKEAGALTAVSLTAVQPGFLAAGVLRYHDVLHTGCVLHGA